MRALSNDDGFLAAGPFRAIVNSPSRRADIR